MAGMSERVIRGEESDDNMVPNKDMKNDFIPPTLGSRAKMLLALAPMNAKLLEVQFPEPGAPKEEVEIKHKNPN